MRKAEVSKKRARVERYVIVKVEPEAEVMLQPVCDSRADTEAVSYVNSIFARVE